MKTSDSLKMILRITQSRYNELAEQSRLEALSNLAPGAAAPAKGKLHTETAKGLMSSFAKEQREKALELIDREMAKVNKAVAAAPSSEAINTLTALSLAKSKDIRDYNAIYSEYGGNAMVANALTTIARENNVDFYAHNPEHDRLESLENCRRTFESVLDPVSVVNGGMSAGRVAFIEMDVEGLDS